MKKLFFALMFGASLATVEAQVSEGTDAVANFNAFTQITPT